MARLWIFLGALLGGLAVIAGAVGAHALPDNPEFATAIRIYNTAQLYHILHALALLAAGSMLWMTAGSRAAWAGLALNFAALAFALGILCFSGGIYAQVAKGAASSGGVVPFGGMCLIAGWALFALSAFGLGRRSPKD